MYVENTWKVITHLKCVCGEYTGEKSIATGVGLNPHDEIFNQKWEGYDETVKEMVEERMENEEVVILSINNTAEEFCYKE